MKALIRHGFTLGNYSFKLETAFYARKVDGFWVAKLNYHKLEVTVEEGEENDTPVFPEVRNLTFQSSVSEGLLSAALIGIHLFGVGATVVSVVSTVLEALLDVGSLVEKVIEALTKQVLTLLNSQEPPDLTVYENTLFVLNLIKNGVHIDRRLPRWRRKEPSILE